MSNTGITPSPGQIQPLPSNSSNSNFGQKMNEVIKALNQFLLSPLESPASAKAAMNRTYVPDSSSLVVLTLPLTATEGDTFTIVGKGSGGWKIAQNALQTIHGSASATTTGTGGTLASGARYNCVSLMCTTANTDFVITSHEGTLSFA